MRTFASIAYLIIVLVAIVTVGICYDNYVNRLKPHTYSTEEIVAQECAKRGGNPTTRVGWDNGIHIQQYNCEVAK